MQISHVKTFIHFKSHIMCGSIFYESDISTSMQWYRSDIKFRNLFFFVLVKLENETSQKQGTNY